MLEVGVSQEFPAGRTRELARKRMEQSAAAAEAVAADRRLAVQREVRRAWTELAYIARRGELVQGQSPWVEQMRASARARYASGEGKQLDLLQAGLDVAMLREQLLDLDRDEAMRRAQLGRWIGEDEARRARAELRCRRAPRSSRCRCWRSGCCAIPRSSTSSGASTRPRPRPTSRSSATARLDARPELRLPQRRRHGTASRVPTW